MNDTDAELSERGGSCLELAYEICVVDLLKAS
jgi:hypothetical protein